MDEASKDRACHFLCDNAAISTVRKAYDNQMASKHGVFCQLHSTCFRLHRLLAMLVGEHHPMFSHVLVQVGRFLRRYTWTSPSSRKRCALEHPSDPTELRSVIVMPVFAKSDLLHAVCAAAALFMPDVEYNEMFSSFLI